VKNIKPKKMAKSELKLVVAVVGAKEAQKQLEAFATSVKGAGDRAITTSKGFGRMRVATAGLRRSVGQLRNILLLATFATAGLRRASRQTTEAFIQQIEAETLLAIGLQRTSNNAEQASERLIQYASALQTSSKFGDEQIIAQMAMLTQFGANEAAIAKLIPHILDLSVGQNGLETVTRAVGQTMKGQVGMMSRLGINIDQFSLAQARAKGSTEEFAFILDVLTQASEGNQKALRELRSSELKQMEMKLGDLSEVMGRVLVPFEIFQKEIVLKGIKGVHLFTIELGKLSLMYKQAFGKITTQEYKDGLATINQEMAEAAKLYDITAQKLTPNIKGQGEINRTLQQRIQLMKLDTALAVEAAKSLEFEHALKGSSLQVEIARSKQIEFNNMLTETFGKTQEEVNKGLQENIGLQIQDKQIKNELVNAEIKLAESKLKATAQGLSGFAQLAATNKKTAKLAQVLAAFEAMINAHAGASRAMKDYPYPFSIVAAGGAYAAGLARVQAIKSQKFAVGGAVGGTTIGDQVPAMLQSGEFVLSKDAVRNIGVETAEAINAGASSGVTVNINAPLVDDTVVDSIIPAIQRARRRGLV
tara:strand:- start:4691 stop:6460 length:1770 start_codon:yes stop_codon:yes gene_type:complete